MSKVVTGCTCHLSADNYVAPTIFHATQTMEEEKTTNYSSFSAPANAPSL